MSEKDELQRIIGECEIWLIGSQHMNCAGWGAMEWSEHATRKLEMQERKAWAELRLREIIRNEQAGYVARFRPSTT